MKTDWDDAPTNLQRKNRRSPLKTILIIGIGCAIAWALALKYGNSIEIDLDQLKQAIRINGKPLFEPESQGLPSPPLQSPQWQTPPPQAPEQQDQTAIRQAEIAMLNRIEALARQRAESELKNNSFNDDNYRPKQPANVYTPPQPTQPAQQQQSQQRRSGPTQERTAIWIKSWNGGSRYLAEWVSVNNYIDSSSVCANHRRRSIDYRECRKAAKQHYHEQCKNWRIKYDNDRRDYSDLMKLRYCSAANTFSPMG